MKQSTGKIAARYTWLTAQNARVLPISNVPWYWVSYDLDPMPKSYPRLIGNAS